MFPPFLRRRMPLVAITLLSMTTLFTLSTYQPTIRETLCTVASGNITISSSRRNITTVPRNATSLLGDTGNSSADEIGDGQEPLLIMPQFPSIMVPEFLETANDVPGYDGKGVKTLVEDSKVAIVTFLDADMESKGEDYYFINTRMLTYQLLYAPETQVAGERRKNTYWVVAVGRLVSQAKREQLRKDGAQVVEIEDLPGIEGLNNGDDRWAHVMNKLRLFEWDHFERILFLDADMVLMGKVDDLFYTFDSIHPKQTRLDRIMPGELMLPESYVFISRPDMAYMGGIEHSYPDDPVTSASYFNAGFWLAAPDKRLFTYFMDLIQMSPLVRPVTLEMPEQNLLNYAFRHCDFFQDQDLTCRLGAPLGPMPWTRLGNEWSSNRPNLKDYSWKVRALHYKGWDEGQDPLRELWTKVRDQMETVLGKWDENLGVSVDVSKADTDIGSKRDSQLQPKT